MMESTYLSIIPKHTYYLIIIFLLSFCSAIPGFSQKVNVSGKVYYDNNRNNIFDGDDSVLVSGHVIASKHSTTTNIIKESWINIVNGSYNMQLDTAYYTFRLANVPNTAYFDYVYRYKLYESFVNDTIDFPIPRKDSIEELHSSISGGNSETIDSSGGKLKFDLFYRFDGSLSSIPVTVSCDFSSKITFVSSSLQPDSSLPGHLVWKFPNQKRVALDTIIIELSFPPVGDTISSFSINPKISTSIAVTKINHVTSYPAYVYTNFPPLKPVGASSGVKWLRTFKGNAQSIDTAKDGMNLYVLSMRYKDNRSRLILSKLNKDGLSVWERSSDNSLPSNISYYGAEVKATADGGCIIISSYEDSLPNSTDGIVAKFDKDGVLTWSKRIGGRYHDNLGGILPLANGDYIITGATSSQDGIFTNNTSDTNHTNLFVARLSNTGNVLWTKTYGGSRDDAGYRLKLLSDNSLLILAYTTSTDGDVNGAHEHGIIDESWDPVQYNMESWILNLDLNGNMLWNRCYGGSGWGIITGAEESNGGILLAGFTNSKNGDLTYYPEKETYLWILHISKTGTINWTKSYKTYVGYQDSNYVNSDFTQDGINILKQAKDGNFIIGRTIKDKYGLIRTVHGKEDFLLMKISPSGDLIWQKALGGTESDVLYDMVIDKNGDIVFTGSTESDNDDLYEPIQRPIGEYVVTVAKVGITNIIKGRVFVDRNGNRIKDAGEQFYNEGRINSVNKTDTSVARIFSGQFLNNVDTGVYVTTYRPVNNYYTIYPTSHTTSFTTFDQKDSIDFALIPKPNVNDLEVQLIPLTVARPGFEATYRIITKNVGTENINNVVISLKKDRRQSFVSATRSNPNVSADTIKWTPFTLNAFESDTLDVTLRQAVPPAVQNGDSLRLGALVTPVINDSTPLNNRSSLLQIVQGSFDPNDKTEMHGGYLTPSQYSSGEYLQYLIRFQNTGTDTAFFVTIKDTLQDKLDLSTLDIISASHSYTFRLEENIGTWNFDMIKLVDSTTNEKESHGYILFKIKPKTGLSIGDRFENTAGIYFDYNLPVQTNIERTSIRSAVVLPVKLVLFSARKDGKNNLIEWRTAGQFNFSHFEVERSIDGRNFNKIGSVPANSIGKYNLTDEQPIKSVNFYRLKMIDNDGKYEYSSVRSIDNSGRIEMSIYPNPAKEILNLTIESEKKQGMQLEVVGLDGKVLISKLMTVQAGTTISQIDVSALQNGSYFIRMKSPGKDQVALKFEKL